MLEKKLRERKPTHVKSQLLLLCEKVDGRTRTGGRCVLLDKGNTTA